MINYNKETKQWYDLLKSKGFKDIEDTDVKGQPLKTWEKSKFSRLDINRFETVKSYFESARDLFSYYDFNSITHEFIWYCHCEGLSKRQIEKELSTKKEPYVKYKRENIGIIINKIRKELL